jgi:hypothetical protein
MTELETVDIKEKHEIEAQGDDLDGKTKAWLKLKKLEWWTFKMHTYAAP